MDDLQRNKDNVLAFYAMAFNDGRPRPAVEQYVGDDYIQHNPHVASGAVGFIAYFEKLQVEHPGKQVIFLRTVAEGNMVMVHTRQVWPGFEDYASVDIFRLTDDGKIVEHWDVMQTVPADQAHDNSMF